MVARGDIWLVSLDPTIGHEIRKTRPAVVVSPNELNESLGTVIIVPMTSSAFPARYRVPIVFQGRRGLVATDQLRTVDNRRLLQRLGRVPGKLLRQTLGTLQEMFAE
ncbi:MAG: type II toxin-antitoxin system PemK/MazF family toxin [Candidatus Eremiobacteraeota bacterium]|nr:type II toxin-antitoxin system PemK/MazF family toxin [Candidatus Eremiobacteraeota bacterium]